MARDLPNMKRCPAHGLYPTRFDSCPQCNPNARSAFVPATIEQIISRMSDAQVEYIFQSPMWEQGTKEARQLCLAEYDKRFGLANWPAHISKEA